MADHYIVIKVDMATNSRSVMWSRDHRQNFTATKIYKSITISGFHTSCTTHKILLYTWVYDTDCTSRKFEASERLDIRRRICKPQKKEEGV